MKLYHMKFTQDKGTTYQIFDVPARSITEAYIELQIRFPSAEITGVEHSGKMITFGDYSWLDMLAKHLVEHATVEQTREITALCDSDMRQELADAIWKFKNKIQKENL